jgi:hypothetical protein
MKQIAKIILDIEVVMRLVFLEGFNVIMRVGTKMDVTAKDVMKACEMSAV